MASLTQNQLEAAKQFARAAIESLPTLQGIHAATAIAGAARMAGTFLFRCEWACRAFYPVAQCTDLEPGNFHRLSALGLAGLGFSRRHN